MTITAKWTGDIPAMPDVLELDLPGLDLALFPAVEASLTDPAGASVDLAGATFALDAEDSTVTVSWGETSRFTARGIHQLQLTLVGFGAIRQRAAPVPVVVETLDGWQTLDAARTQWPDAPYDDAQLFDLLDIARGQVTAYAPTLAEGAPTPTTFKRAQLMQARNLWNATKDNGQQEIGAEGFVVRIVPLDWHVRQLLRPKRAVPAVG